MSLRFVKFCSENNDEFISIISRLAMSMPPKMNECDHRFELSKFHCYQLCKPFEGILSVEENEGYDIVHKHVDKISIKIQQEIFQRNLKCGYGLTVPKTLTMKNCLGGSSSKKKELNIDYLMAIQRGVDTGTGSMFIGFGVISKKNLTPLFEYGDQLKIKIENRYFDYLSPLYEIPVSLDNQKSKSNRIYCEGQAVVYNRIYKSVPALLIKTLSPIVQPQTKKTRKTFVGKRKQKVVSTVKCRRKKY